MKPAFSPLIPGYCQHSSQKWIENKGRGGGFFSITPTVTQDAPASQEVINYFPTFPCLKDVSFTISKCLNPLGKKDLWVGRGWEVWRHKYAPFMSLVRVGEIAFSPGFTPKRLCQVEVGIFSYLVVTELISIVRPSTWNSWHCHLLTYRYTRNIIICREWSPTETSTSPNFYSNLLHGPSSIESSAKKVKS